jgi:hypothetical protein
MKKELKSKMELEVLKTMIAINKETTQDELWLKSDTPHMHEHYIKRLDSEIKTYVKRLKPLLVTNKKYVLNLTHSVLPYDDKNNFVQFLFDNMVYGKYVTEYDNYLYDINTPFAEHKYEGGGKTMDDNKSEIIECLHLSILTFYVDNDGNTIINGFVNGWEQQKVKVKINKNIFDTDFILNISLITI